MIFEFLSSLSQDAILVSTAPGSNCLVDAWCFKCQWVITPYAWASGSPNSLVLDAASIRESHIPGAWCCKHQGVTTPWCLMLKASGRHNSLVLDAASIREAQLPGDSCCKHQGVTTHRCLMLHSPIFYAASFRESQQPGVKNNPKKLEFLKKNFYKIQMCPCG